MVPLSSEEDRNQRVLAMLNVARTAFGDPPLSRIPGGIKGMSFDCPIAVAIGHMVNVTGTNANFYLSDLEKWDIERVRHLWGSEECSCGYSFCVPLPGLLVEWIADFDKGLFPEYEAYPLEYERRNREEADRKARQERFELEIEGIENRFQSPSRGRASRFE